MNKQYLRQESSAISLDADSIVAANSLVQVSSTDQSQSQISVDILQQADYKINQSHDVDLSRSRDLDGSIQEEQIEQTSGFNFRQSVRSMSMNYKAARKQLLDDIVPREDQGQTSKYYIFSRPRYGHKCHTFDGILWQI